MSLNTKGKPNKIYPAFNDDDLMQFGKYIGERLSDVPASYFSWLYNQSDDPLVEYVGLGTSQSCKLANYIYNSRNAINSEIGTNEIN